MVILRRSLAVLVAGLVSQLGDQDPDKCDAWAAIGVSVIILVAVVPLVKGLRKTLKKLKR